MAVCALSAAIAVAALSAAAWAVFSGQLGAQGIDALFLLCVCLLTALVFGAIPLTLMRRGQLGNLLKRRPREQPERGAAAALSPNPQERSE
jgi:hypothetical protein